jgi:hypothetical protein
MLAKGIYMGGLVPKAHAFLLFLFSVSSSIWSLERLRRAAPQKQPRPAHSLRRFHTSSRSKRLFGTRCVAFALPCVTVLIHPFGSLMVEVMQHSRSDLYH